MRKLFFLLLFIGSLIAAAIAFTPLGFVLSQSGLDKAGAGWAKVDGSISNGRISGLYIQNQPVGDVTLKLRPLSLLSLAPVYDVQWGGAGGRGTGIVRLSRAAIDASELRAQQDIGAIEALMAPVRAIGGSIRIADGTFKLTRAGCESASGRVTTDALARAAEQYGKSFNALEGSISCDAGRFLLAMSGQSDTSDTVQINAEAGLLTGSKADIRIATEDGQIIFVLNQLGFTRQDETWVYTYSTQGGHP
jgi:hypothetical protein